MMRRMTAALAIAAAATAIPINALAQWRCDCTTIVASCTATVTPRENWIDVTTDSRQCARVDYLIDGLPFVTTVVEGQHRLDWMSPRSNPDILIQGCQVCADNAAADMPSESGPPTDDGDDGPPEPLIRWSPEYPEQAQLRGLEGYVAVEFDLMPDGSVANAAVVESEPGELFDRAALDAVRRWRYAPDEQRPETRLMERIEFSLGDMIWQLRPAGGRALAESDARLPRNQCIREDAVYDFGEMLEAELINACAEPLLVYGCAEGIGRQAERWVCSASERAGTLLVRPGDERLGGTFQDGQRVDSVASLTYRDNFYVARAPNSQYWWIACRPADTACRDEARLWVRAMDRQPSSIDPRGRAAITIARSY